MKKIIGTLLIICTVTFCKAQWVTIPDANFRIWLNTHGYSSCMNGNQLNINCNLVLNANFIDCSYSNIYDLSGIQFFTSLTYLNCMGNNISWLENLPTSLENLICIGNQLGYLNTTYLSNLIWLECPMNNITLLDDLPNNLQYLYCYNNQLTSLPYLPTGLISLICGNNPLTELPPLPSNLGELSLTNTQVTNLPLPFPTSLASFFISNSPISSIPCSFQNFTGTEMDFGIGGSNVVCFPGSIQHAGSIPAIDTMPICACVFPSGISVSNITSTSAKVNWNSECCLQYQIQVRVTGTTTWSTALVNSTATSKTLTTLIPGTTYDLRERVKCMNGTSYSSWSPIQTFTTLCNCAKPTGITVTSISQTSAIVNWVGNSCAYRYRLQYRKTGTTTWTTKQVLAPIVTKTLTGLTANTTYEYHIRTECNSSATINSGYTTIATFTTPLRLEDESSNAISMSVTPNPCTTCEISGVENASDLFITDILGRKINASFTKSSNGYFIDLVEASSGIFFIRNIKTGEVVKFVKE